MAENLKVIRYQNGDVIPNVSDKSEWASLTYGAHCINNNDDSNTDTYGLLYNWFAMDDSRKIAPKGWHVPSDDEWKQLEMFLGMSQLQADATGWRAPGIGGKMKEEGTIYWKNPNRGASNEVGFSALPGGVRDFFGNFYSNGNSGSWWTATEDNTSNAWGRELYYDFTHVLRYSGDKRNGLSVRCVKD